MAIVILPCQAAEPPAQGVNADWIVARLARPLPSRTPFIELRGSALLKAPLRIQGEYRRPEDGVLVRAVTSPYVEQSTIARGQVRISRDGGATRSFALSKAPALIVLQNGFGALLAGDAARLREHFRIDSQGTRHHWTLALTPRDAGLAEQVGRITLHGRGSELRCIRMQRPDGDAQRTLLAGAAVRAAADSGLDADALAALCHGGDAAQ